MGVTHTTIEKRAVRRRRQSVSDSDPTLSPSTRFAAIDFETADSGRDSACALAVVVVENGKIARREHRLIKPPRRDFIFSYLHGITWADVAGEPEFDAVWSDMASLIKDVDFIAAHNASFDRGVLRDCCELAGIRPPAAPFVCTVKLARRAWDIRPTKLPDVCRKFRIKLNHHNALSDATACARIVIRAVKAGFDPMSVVSRA